MNTLTLLSRAVSRRSLHTTRVVLSAHTSDSYSKDVDASPPPDSKIHRVDPDGAAQKPYEQPTTKHSEVGAGAAFKTMSKDEPYKAPGPKERYGAVPELKKDVDENAGPAGKDSHGRS
ncbi:hypothetical protein CYLTODRAFT_187773 [Cylindrobasidium torrendii FP15055 ss-10]|uniref:Uncharacterized protein n=1 Tax=Cylindrobasidium torrendii FP15055 ss-10 TaxID=1314674 RepID=A0A0D7BLA4_9AGAR|nr:hypothetical protein CYLTODRAFT_187773 [Cylindrobasidium torrendii FP15055 ss-10]